MTNPPFFSPSTQVIPTKCFFDLLSSMRVDLLSSMRVAEQHESANAKADNSETDSLPAYQRVKSESLPLHQGCVESFAHLNDHISATSAMV
jgi:hypothetical protein